LRFGYNTNGLAHHRPLDALRLAAAIGYRGVALTPDVGQLDPYRLDPREVRAVRDLARELDLWLTIETGARFLLDPARKHAPNLCDPEPAAARRRVDFYRRCVDLAVDLGAPLMSLWAGAAGEGQTLDPWVDAAAHPSDLDAGAQALAPGAPAAVGDTLARLVEGLAAVIAHADTAGVAVGFEPEPGMFVERPCGYGALRDRLRARGASLALTLDLGHCVVTSDPVDGVLARFGADLAHVHIADCPRGVHEHVQLGQGDLDLPAALGALERGGFVGLAAVELSRDSHRGPAAAHEALALLRRSATFS